MTSTLVNVPAAVAALERLLPMEHPADAVLSRFFRDRPKLGSRDRAFVAEAVFGVLRHWRFLDEAAEARTPRHKVLAWLARFGGYNLRQLAPVLDEGEADLLAQVKGIDPERLSPGVQAEFPDWLLQALQQRLGPADALALGRCLQQPAPLDLRVNTLLAGRDEILAELAGSGIAATAMPYSPAGIRLAKKMDIHRSPLFLEGKVEVQDEGSQLLGFLMAPRRGEMVADFCAGSGGKTLHLGALMRSQGRIYAFDVSERRLSNLRPRANRARLTNVHTVRIDSENDLKVKRLAGKIDRVLVDAPCSGVGTLRRNPDLKFRQSPAAVAELNRKQGAILAAASRLVKPGGRLVYATCSFLPEENQTIVAGFLGAYPEFGLVPAGAVLAEHRIPLAMGDFLELWPHRHGTDGFFAAVMQRQETKR